MSYPARDPALAGIDGKANAARCRRVEAFIPATDAEVAA